MQGRANGARRSTGSEPRLSRAAACCTALPGACPCGQMMQVPTSKVCKVRAHSGTEQQSLHITVYLKYPSSTAGKGARLYELQSRCMPAAQLRELRLPAARSFAGLCRLARVLQTAHDGRAPASSTASRGRFSCGETCRAAMGRGLDDVKNSRAPASSGAG